MTKLRAQIAIVALLTMYAGGAAAAGEPVITVQPADAATETGAVAWLNVTATSTSGVITFQWYRGGAGDTSDPVWRNSPNFQAKDLREDTRFWVRVSNQVGSVDSRVATVTIIPTHPERVTATDGLFQDRVRVTWDAVGNAASYRVYRGPNTTFSNSAPVGNSTTPLFNDTTATPGTRYFYFVKTIDGGGEVGGNPPYSQSNDGRRATAPLDGSFVPVRDASDIVFSEQGGALFITTETGFLEHYGIGSQSILASHRISRELRGIDIAPDDSFLLVADRIEDENGGKGHVLRVDPATGSAAPLVYDLDDGEGGSFDVAIFSNSSAFVATEFNGSGSVPFRELNPGTGAFTVRVDVPGTPSRPGFIIDYSHLFRNPGRTHMAILEAGLSSGPWFTYESAGDTFGSPQQFGHSIQWGAINRDGTLVAISKTPGAQIFTPAGVSAGEVPNTGNATAVGMRFSPSLNELYVTDPAANLIRGFETVTWQEAFTLPVPSNFNYHYPFGEGNLEISSDGKTLAVVTGTGVELLDLNSRFPAGPPAPPQNLTATNDSGAHVELVWTPVAGAQSYTIYRHTVNNPGGATAIASGYAGAVFADATAQIGTTYYYWVRAFNASSQSGLSASVSGTRVTPVVTITTQPLDAAIKFGGYANPFVNATSNSGTLSYQWYQGNLGDTSNPVGSGNYYIELDNQTVNTHYWVRISNAFASADSRLVTVAVLPDKPRFVTATEGLFQSHIRVTWERLDEAVSYRVFRGTSLSFSSSSFLADAAVNEFEDSTAVAGTRYWYFVTAVDADGDEGEHDPYDSDYNDGVRATQPLDGDFIPIRDVEDFVFDSPGGKLFISTEGGIIERYDTGAEAVTGHFNVGRNLKGLDISPDDTFLLAAMSQTNLDSTEGYIYRIETADGAMTPLPYPFDVPTDINERFTFDVGILSDDSAFVTSTGASLFVRFRQLNPGSGVFTIRTDTPGSASGGRIWSGALVLRNPARTLAAVLQPFSNGPWFSYDPVTDAFDGSHSLSSAQRWGSVGRYGNLVAMADDSGFKVFSPDGTPVHDSNHKAAGMRFSPLLNELYVANYESDEINVYNTVTWQSIATLPIPGGIDAGSQFGEGTMEISPDGRTLALGTETGVSLFDLSNRLPAGPPPAPVNVTASDDSGDHVAVSWAPLSGADSYKVYRHTANIPGASTEIATGFFGTNYLDTTAPIGTGFFYWVKANNVVGDSGFSNSDAGIRVPPAVTITSQPAYVAIEPWETADLTVSATTNSGTLSYQWYRGAAGDTSNPVGTDSPNFTTPALNANTSYWVRISNGTVSEDSQLATAGVVPGRPRYVTATDGLFQDRIRVNWDAIPEAVSYNIYRSPVASYSNATFLVSTASNLFNDTTGNAGIRYYYYVKAVDAEGDEGNYDTDDSDYRHGVRGNGPLDGSLVPVRDAVDFVFDDQNGRMFISTEGGIVEQYDVAAPGVPKYFHIGGRLSGIDVSPDGSYLLVTKTWEDAGGGQGIVYRIDLGDDTITPLPFNRDGGEGGSFDVAIFSNTSALVTTQYIGPGWVPLRELNPATGVFTVRGDAPGSGPGDKVRSYSCLHRNHVRTHGIILEAESPGGPWFTYESSGDTFGGSQDLNQDQRWGSVNPGGTLVAVSSYPTAKIFEPDGTLVRDLTSSSSAAGMRFSPLLNELYVADWTADVVRGFDTGTWQELFTVPIPGGLDWNYYLGEGNLEISPDGRILALATDDGVRLLNLNTRFPPATPVNVTASDSSPDHITVSWDAVDWAADYTVFRHTANDSGAAVAVASGFTGTVFTDTTAVVGTMYYYWVSAQNAGGESGLSIFDSGLRVLSPPVINTQPADTEVETGQSLTLAIGATTNAGALNYQWYRGGAGDTSGPVGGNSSSLNLTNQTQSGTWWVRVSNAAGTVDSRVATVTVLPAKPDGLAATNLVTGVRLGWNPVAGILEYRVFRGTGPSGFSSAQIATVSSGTEYTDSSGQAGRAYYYFIRSAANGNLSGYSVGVTGKRLYPGPAAVTATVNYFDDKVRLNWAEVPGASAYVIYRNGAPDGSGAVEVGRIDGGTRSYDDASGSPGTGYFYSVTAEMPDGDESVFSAWTEGEISAETTFRPDELIGRSAASRAGDGIYNTSGSGQTVQVRSKRRKVLRFFLLLENDGVNADDVTVRGTRGNRLFRATYFEKPAAGGRLNVTGAVVAGIHQAALDGGAQVELELETKRKGRKTRGLKGRTFVVSAISGNAPERRDSVIGKAKSR